MILCLALAGCRGNGLGLEADATANVNVDKPIRVVIEGLAIEYQGTFVPAALFAQVKDGDRDEYVRAILGEPDQKSDLSDGTTIYRWHFRPKTAPGTLVSLLGNRNNAEVPPEQVTTIVIFKSGLVTQKWRG